MADPRVPPPPPARREPVADVIHGVEVRDPFRWLEEGDADEVRAWVAAQNARTRQALDSRPDRSRWHGRLVELMELPAVLGVATRRDLLFVLERAGGAEQHSLGVRIASDPTSQTRTLVDPAALAADAAVAIDWFEPSNDGCLVAYGLSEGGTENSTLRVLDVASGAALADVIPDTRAASIAWSPDGGGFWYTRYPHGDEYNRHVRFHRLGDDPAEDALVWDRLPRPEAWPAVQASLDGAYLLVEVLVGWGSYDVHLLHVPTGDWQTVTEGEEAVHNFTFDPAGARLVGVTTLDAPRGRVVAAPLTDPGQAGWTTVVAEGEAVLASVTPCGADLLVVAGHHAVDRIDRYGAGGEFRETLDLGVVSIASLDTDVEAGTAFAVVTGYHSPPTIWRWCASADVALEAWPARGASDCPLPALTVTRVAYLSRDGTEIGMFLVHRDDVRPSAMTPALLTGYGGFAISSTPAFSPLAAAWCEAGGLYAVAGLRGGTENGEAWHHAGRRECKQNVFDDFAAAADHLVTEGMTARDRLAIAGGSNGGLLMGASLTQRPDLAAAVWCAVPLLDMIRFPRFLIARLWTDEYGDPDVAEEFAWLHAYSPYHHVVEGGCYPPVLLTTAEGDSRVDPLHARKMAALLQHASSCQDDNPVLLLQAERAGHGQGKPASKRAAEAADVLAFVSWQLG